MYLTSGHTPEYDGRHPRARSPLSVVVCAVRVTHPRWPPSHSLLFYNTLDDIVQSPLTVTGGLKPAGIDGAREFGNKVRANCGRKDSVRLSMLPLREITVFLVHSSMPPVYSSNPSLPLYCSPL